MTTALMQQNKARVWEFWQQLSNTNADTVRTVVERYVHQAVAWIGPHPINQLHGSEQLVVGYWQPLLRSFPDLQRNTDVLLSGQWNGKDWVAATGYFTGTFERDWLTIPKTGKSTRIRFGEFCSVESGKIGETYVLLDLVDVMLQAGYRVLPPSRGDEAAVPGPTGGDGVLLTPQSDEATDASMQLVLAMFGGLGRFDRATVRSMNMEAFWHPHMHWYGPCGIGSARSLEHYYHVHASHFLQAFPDRGGGSHAARVAEGKYVASTGWPSVQATHTGEWLGCPPTGARIGMRVMDFWRRDGDKLAQNWVLIDIIDIFRQFGIDLFARLEHAVDADRRP